MWRAPCCRPRRDEGVEKEDEERQEEVEEEEKEEEKEKAEVVRRRPRRRTSRRTKQGSWTCLAAIAVAVPVQVCVMWRCGVEWSGGVEVKIMNMMPPMAQ